MSEDSSTQRVRLNKLIADSGLASRRHADRMIEEGLVTVNGKRVYELGVKVDPTHDKIMVDGKPLRKPLTQKLFLVFNKPTGVLTTMEDPEGRPTVAEYLAKVPGRVFPVGRLDWDSEGMLLLTNDGDYANKVMHPKAEVTKTYLVKLDGQPQPHQLEKLRKGVTIIGGKVSAKHIEKIKKTGDNKSDKYEWLKIVITEGKNRQIRQMFAKIGFDVLRLQRVAIGRLRMGALKAGELVYINDVAANRVFLADDPDDLKKKKDSYKGRAGEQGPAAKRKAAKLNSRGKPKLTGTKAQRAYKAKAASASAKK
ncbi:pseudouridine synthase [Bdellovibrio sp. NC01]|uniref:pseudouridine synthase n=1 Tax=Bdellovibrio sp. NC01 TaxID=2220073 RepID=UPI00115B5FF0|nr:pseudouridine synthase [Bdellovibrio sp. NC01]QDK38999.1 rRNA pseudouridine synthase [Bdellovibrio sp. NC01]